MKAATIIKFKKVKQSCKILSFKKTLPWTIYHYFLNFLKLSDALLLIFSPCIGAPPAGGVGHLLPPGAGVDELLQVPFI